MSSSTTGIPLFYRVLFTWWEPFSALGGSVMATFTPKDYLNVMAPHGVYEPSLQVVFDQIAACYVLFAFSGAVVLRVTREIAVWKAMLAGMLLCDVLHIYGTTKALGLEVILNPVAWRWEDWINNGTLVGMLLLRAAFLLGGGFGADSKQKQKTG